MRYVFLIVSIGVISFAQNGGNTAVGSWSAELEGHSYVRLELHSAAGKLSGTLAVFDIQVDDQGGVRSVGELPHDAIPIFDVSQQGSTVTFSRKDEDDTDRFEFRLIDSTHGELRFLMAEDFRAELSANGIATPKPFLLTRQTSSK
jgi:hypothetical protein